MKHFENNIMDGQSTVEAINDLNELSGGDQRQRAHGRRGRVRAEQDGRRRVVEPDRARRGRAVALPESVRREGYEFVNKHIDRELVEKAHRDEAEQAAKRVVRIIVCPKED